MITSQHSGTEDSISQYKERIANISSDFEFGLFVFLFRKSLLWIVIFFLFAAGIFFIYLRYTSPVYESKIILQIAPENGTNKILNIDNKYYENQENIAKSVELLKSKIFLKRVLSELPLNITYFAEGTFRANEHYNVSAYSVKVIVKEKSVAGTKINIQFDDKYNGEITYSANNRIRSFKFKSDKCLSTAEMDVTISITNYEDIKKHHHDVWVDDCEVYGATIKNGDFEMIGNDNKPAYWGWKGSPDRYITDGTQARSGRCCVLIWHDTPLIQKIEVRAGKSYRISAWFKAYK